MLETACKQTWQNTILKRGAEKINGRKPYRTAHGEKQLHSKAE